MVLHLGSIWLIGALTAFFYGVLMLVVRPASSDDLSHTLISSGFSGVSLGLAFLLRSGVPMVSEELRLLTANALVMLGLGLGYRAIAEMKRRPSSIVWLILPPAISLSSTLWFSFVYRNITICQLIYNMEDTAMLLSIVWLIESNGTQKTPRSDRLAAVAFLFLALFTLTQVLLFVVAGNFPRKYDFDQPRAVYNVVVSISCASLIYFLLLLMLFERLNEKLVVQAMRDSLTDVYNRRAFEEIAFREISGARRSGMPLALIVCDIDRFKAINDTFGHLAGDEVLLDVARLLRANLRDEDTLCRWGGDEFVALLPRAGSEDAHQAARRIALAFENGLFHVAKTQIPVSVSLGVAAGDRLNGDLPALLQEADQAMYRAKQRFREAATVAAAAAEPVAQPPA